MEVAKTLRPVVTKSKGKAKAKGAPTQSESTYDYHDGSIYDLALKTYILRGYDQFKVGFVLAIGSVDDPSPGSSRTGHFLLC